MDNTKYIIRALILCVAATVILTGTDSDSITQSSYSEKGVRVFIDTGIFHRQDLYSLPSVKFLYTLSSYSPVWHNEMHRTAAADSMLYIIRNARDYGLVAAEYHIVKLDSLLQEASNPAVETQIEVFLTDAFFKFGGHLRQGRVVQKTETLRTYSNEVDTLLVQSLLAGSDGNQIRKELQRNEPGNIHYQRLLERYRTLLRRFDNDLMSFDERSEKRLELLKSAVNLERLRWDLRQFNNEHLMINIPAFRLDLYKNDSLVLTSRVIVGKPDTPTPELTSEVECIRIYPYWNVPRSIATKEILPILKKDSAYLDRANFEVLNSTGYVVDASVIDWKPYSINNFPYTLRQREGSDNALGVIKFQFDNPYGVYLHDTNAKNLFRENRRALSHGCIRVQDAVALAHELVSREGSRIPPAMLNRYLSEKKRREINLKRPMAIYTRYRTADEHGCYEDVYARDRQLMDLFMSVFPVEQPVPMGPNTALVSLTKSHVVDREDLAHRHYRIPGVILRHQRPDNETQK